MYIYQITSNTNEKAKKVANNISRCSFFKPVLLAALLALSLARSNTIEAHANSVAKIPSPAKIINQPGPGVIKKTRPITVTAPPITPIRTRLANAFMDLDYPLISNLETRARHPPFRCGKIASDQFFQSAASA
jgi:hypothetical protein